MRYGSPRQSLTAANQGPACFRKLLTSGTRRAEANHVLAGRIKANPRAAAIPGVRRASDGLRFFVPPCLPKRYAFRATSADKPAWSSVRIDIDKETVWIRCLK